jgi:hypothetical protein
MVLPVGERGGGSLAGGLQGLLFLEGNGRGNIIFIGDDKN